MKIARGALSSSNITINVPAGVLVTVVSEVCVVANTCPTGSLWKKSLKTSWILPGLPD